MSDFPPVHFCDECGTVVSWPGLCSSCREAKEAEERPTRPLPVEPKDE